MRPLAVPLEFAPDDRYLIGVSGGRDSVALLHQLLESGYGRLIVCHLDHGLRGRASRADARFVEKLSERHNLICEIGQTDVRAFAAREKLSIETAARAARFAFFAATARRRRCREIFLAHHADDLVETFLLNLFRGSGPAGLSSLRAVSVFHLGNSQLTLIRPLLSVWRNEIDEFIQTRGLKFREDVSNQDLGPLRNRIRRRVIPYLEKTFGRSIRRSIWRAAMIAAEENAWMNQMLPAPGRELPAEILRAQPIAAQRRALHAWLRQHEVADVGFDLIERVRALLEPNASMAKTNLPRDRYVRRRAKKLFIDD